jgi:hypothetical protein
LQASILLLLAAREELVEMVDSALVVVLVAVVEAAQAEHQTVEPVVQVGLDVETVELVVQELQELQDP